MAEWKPSSADVRPRGASRMPGFCPRPVNPVPQIAWCQLRLLRLGLDVGCGSSHLPADDVVCGGVGEGVPRDGQRVGHIGGGDRQRDRYRTYSAPRRCSEAISAAAMARSAGWARARSKAGADCAPGTLATAARHGEPHRVARRPPGSGRPHRHAFMITYCRWPARSRETISSTPLMGLKLQPFRSALHSTPQAARLTRFTGASIPASSASTVRARAFRASLEPLTPPLRNARRDTGFPSVAHPRATVRA